MVEAKAGPNTVEILEVCCDICPKVQRPSSREIQQRKRQQRRPYSGGSRVLEERRTLVEESRVEHGARHVVAVLKNQNA